MEVTVTDPGIRQTFSDCHRRCRPAQWRPALHRRGEGCGEGTTCRTVDSSGRALLETFCVLHPVCGDSGKFPSKGLGAGWPRSRARRPGLAHGIAALRGSLRRRVLVLAPTPDPRTPENTFLQSSGHSFFHLGQLPS